MHNLQVMIVAVASGVVTHLSLWEGWAVLFATVLLVWQGAVWWIPIASALIINPEPYTLVAGIVHGRHTSLYTAILFTLCQLVLAFGGFAAARLVKRLR